ncbi:MAG: response regulator [Pseudomonadota bacterium]
MDETTENKQEKRFRVLLVDDDPQDSMFLKRAFDDFPDLIDVTAIFSGFDAINAIKSVDRDDPNLPHLIVLDLGLPGVSGEKVLQVKNSWTPALAVPLVIFTGRSEKDEFVEKVRKDPTVLVLHKPDSRGGYADAMQKMLRFAVKRHRRLAASKAA